MKLRIFVTIAIFNFLNGSIGRADNSCVTAELIKIRAHILSLATENSKISEVKVGILGDGTGEKPVSYISYSYREVSSGGRNPSVTDRIVVGQNLYDENCNIIYQGRPVTVR